MSISSMHNRIGTGRLVAIACCIAISLLIVGITPDSSAAALKQKSFASPNEAVTALVAAVRGEDMKEMLAILGPDSKELLSSGDDVADKAGREKFLNAYDQKSAIVQKSVTTMVLQTGNDDWLLPIPLVKKGSKWVFDTAKGKREILKRRIGRNELHVMEVLDSYLDAQHEYATRDCRGGGTVEFAQRIISSAGTKDGLFWPAKEGDEQSPLGPLVAQAAQEGYGTESDLSPFHGYYFKILKGQGKHASGGTYQYVVNGKMILGFALIAYPAEYGNSGVMTFMVNQEGTIYEKNLGRDTRSKAAAIKTFDPDKTWRPVKGDQARKVTGPGI